MAPLTSRQSFQYAQSFRRAGSGRGSEAEVGSERQKGRCRAMEDLQGQNLIKYFVATSYFAGMDRLDEQSQD